MFSTAGVSNAPASALIIAVGAYPALDEAHQLPGVAADLAIHLSRCDRVLGMPAAEIRVCSSLADGVALPDGVVGAAATAAGITAGLGWLAGRAAEGRRVLVVFAGHGFHDGDVKLCPADVGPDGAGALSWEALQAIVGRKSVWILDCGFARPTDVPASGRRPRAIAGQPGADGWRREGVLSADVSGRAWETPEGGELSRAIALTEPRITGSPWSTVELSAAVNRVMVDQHATCFTGQEVYGWETGHVIRRLTHNHHGLNVVGYVLAFGDDDPDQLGILPANTFEKNRTYLVLDPDESQYHDEVFLIQGATTVTDFTGFTVLVDEASRKFSQSATTLQSQSYTHRLDINARANNQNDFTTVGYLDKTSGDWFLLEDEVSGSPAWFHHRLIRVLTAAGTEYQLRIVEVSGGGTIGATTEVRELV